MYTEYNFWILPVYLVFMLNSLVSSTILLDDSIEFFKYSLMLSVNNENFTTFLQFRCLLFLLLASMQQQEPLLHSRIQMVKANILGLFPISEERFNISPLSTMWTVGCFVMPFTELRRLSSWFAERFHHDGVLNFAKCFFCIYHEFFSFILLSGVFHWLGFQVFNQPYICGINPTSLW